MRVDLFKYRGRKILMKAGDANASRRPSLASSAPSSPQGISVIKQQKKERALWLP
jgi:hypothetical protein